MRRLTPGGGSTTTGPTKGDHPIAPLRSVVRGRRRPLRLLRPRPDLRIIGHSRDQVKRNFDYLDWIDRECCELDMEDARRARLGRLITKEKFKFTYTYDFGDNWGHEVLVERIMPPEAGDRTGHGGAISRPPVVRVPATDLRTSASRPDQRTGRGAAMECPERQPYPGRSAPAGP